MKKVLLSILAFNIFLFTDLSAFTDAQYRAMPRELRNILEKAEYRKKYHNMDQMKVGKKVFSHCMGCHGKNGDKPAFGKTRLLTRYSKNGIEDALHKYKRGSINLYGFGSIMHSAALRLSEDEIKAVATYIQSLRKRKKERFFNH